MIGLTPQALLGRMINAGDELSAGSLCGCKLPVPFNVAEWNVLRRHMEYAQRYNDIKLVSLRDGSSINIPGTPGFYIDREVFWGNDYVAVMVLVHEAMHDYYWGHGEINKVIGPYTDNNMFSRFYDFLNKTKCGNKSLWGIIK